MMVVLVSGSLMNNELEQGWKVRRWERVSLK